MSENSTTLKSNFIFSEAPASWNTRYLSPDGFICQLTLRGESGKELWWTHKTGHFFSVS